MAASPSTPEPVLRPAGDAGPLDAESPAADAGPLDAESPAADAGPAPLGAASPGADERPALLGAAGPRTAPAIPPDPPQVRSRLRARLARALRPPRRAIPTVPGLFALGAPTFLGLAAVTATNNLLFLLLGATLGAIVLSGILSERSVRPIRVRVRAVGPVYAGIPARLDVRFEREGARASVGPIFDLRFREAPGSLLGAWRRRQRPPAVLDVHLPVLEGASATVVGERVFDRRGRARLPLSEVSTRYPFGLLVKSKDVEPDLEVRVRPKIVAPPAALLRPPRVEGLGSPSRQRGQGLDVHGLRERAERDPIHRVHALRSLALGRQVVLEMSGLERPTAELGLAGDPSSDPEAWERTLEVAQAILRAWSEDGYAVGLVTPDRLFRAGEHPVEVLLDHLADLEPGPVPTPSHPPGCWLVPSGARRPASGTAYRVSADGRVEAA